MSKIDKQTLNESELFTYMQLYGSYSLKFFFFFKICLDLTENRKKHVVEEEASLLFDNDAPLIKKQTNNSLDEELYPHLRNNTYVNLVHDTNIYAKSQIPPQLRITFDKYIFK